MSTNWQYAEINGILDLERVFSENQRMVIGTAFSDDKSMNTDKIVSYLKDNDIVSETPALEAKLSDKQSGKKRNSKSKSRKLSFGRMFSNKSVVRKEVVMILGLDKVGKTKLIDSFGFGKRSTTSIALFEAEMLKGDHLEMYDWNYEQRSWPMAKSFFANCSLVIFVIDGTAPAALSSEKKNVWTAEAYLKKLLSIGLHDDAYKTDEVNGLNVDGNGDDEKKEEEETEQFVEEWPLMDTPFLIYLNKSDLDECSVTAQDVEEELNLSRMMKYRRTKYRVQECSAKTKDGVYDGLIWCRMNGLLGTVSQIKEYADKHEIKLPLDNANGSELPSLH